MSETATDQELRDRMNKAEKMTRQLQETFNQLLQTHKKLERREGDLLRQQLATTFAFEFNKKTGRYDELDPFAVANHAVGMADALIERLNR